MKPARPPRRKEPTYRTEGAGFDTPRTYGNGSRVPVRIDGLDGRERPAEGDGKKSPFTVAPAFVSDDDERDRDEGIVLSMIALALICVTAYAVWILLAALDVP